jgi:hypothetical protein
MNIKNVQCYGGLAWRTNGDVYGVKCQINVGYNYDDFKNDHGGTTVVIKPKCFEVSDVKTGGNIIYEEGSLIFEGKELVDYDGTSELAMPIIDILEHKGYNVAHIKETL